MKTPSTLAAPPAAPVGMERRFGVADVLRKLGVQTRPPRCGRYELLEKLGEGGMGSVFRARDPKLGRDVAIKLLREDADPDARRWLRREAQALARLNDPRVVTALAVGEEQAQTWIAMELVQGQTLGQWAEASDRNKPRFRRRALALLREAGLGIAAAHRRGLVHRDVKPANILIGDDGQVKVADFGLARINVSAAASMVTQSGSENDQESRVTAAYAGTPRYMAPEQHMGQGADARSDQYAFAVTAWEVLTGEPPFRGNTMIALAESKFDDDVAPGDDLPRELRHALHKAMRAASKDRFGDMDELLTALARRPRRGKVWAIPTVALAGVAAWALLDTSPPKHPCADLIPPQWGATEQAALNASFVGSEDLRAPQAWQAIDSDLDEYVATWARERDQICAATPPSPPRVRCLERSAQVFGQVLETAGERPALARSREALLSAMPTVDCNSTTRDQTPAHEEIEGALAKAAILRVAGRRDEERRVLEALEPKVRRLGDPSELTRFLSTLGASYSNLGRPNEAAATLAEAHAVAVEDHDDARALDVSVEAIEAMLETGAPPSATRTWIEHAKVAHARLGEPENTDAVWMFVREAELARAQEQPERALEIQHHALAIAIGLDATSSGVYQARAVAHQSLADVYLRQSDLDLAEEHVHAIIENYAAALGADHPRTLDMHSYLGDLHYGRERFEQAAQAYETAVAGARVVFGPKSASMSIVLGKVARVHRALGQYERGIEVATQALEVAEAVNPNSRFVSEALSELGLSQQLAGQLSAARSTTQRALTIIEENQGSDAFDMAPVLHDLGEIAYALGDDEAASRNLLRSLEIAEAYLGPDGVNLAYPLAALARVRDHQGDEDAAASLRARARALAVDHPDPALRAELQLEP